MEIGNQDLNPLICVSVKTGDVPETARRAKKKDRAFNILGSKLYMLRKIFFK